MFKYNILKMLINVCLILLLAFSLPTSSLTTVSHYKLAIPATPDILNVYIIQNYTTRPLEVQVGLTVDYIDIKIFNTSILNITGGRSLISNVSFNGNYTCIEIFYLNASNMSIRLVTLNDVIKIIGNVSYLNESISLGIPNSYTSANTDNNSFNYPLFILVLIVSVIVYFVLKRYKGH